MIKKLTAFILCLLIISTTCFGAVTVLDDEYIINVNEVTITGTAEKGNSLGYTVMAKNDDASDNTKLKATGDVVANSEDGKFTIKFILPDNTATGDYTVRVGRMGGAETKTKDIHFINVSNTYAAIKAATTLDELKAIFAPALEHTEALGQLGYDLTAINSAVSPAGKIKLLTAFLADSERGTAMPTEQVGVLNKYLALEMINEKKQGGMDKINPSFENEGNFSGLTDASLKSYLTDATYQRAPYNTPEEVYAVYKELNILYKLNNSATGEFADIADKYKNELGIEGTAYYKAFGSMPSTNRNRAANFYIGYIENEAVNTYADFRRVFEKAINAAKKTDDSHGSGGGSGGGGGGGGGSYAGGGTSITTSKEPSSVLNQAETQKIVFTDTAGVEWAKEAIDSLAEKGIINGTAPGKFDPNANITREQIVKMILLSIGKAPTTQDVPFSDVKVGEWYTPYIAEAYNLGIINGINENEFGTGKNLTRQDLAVIVVRAAEFSGKTMDFEATDVFRDNADIADYAKTAVNKLYSAGAINGKDGSCFAPNDFCTRAEAAKILYNVFFK